MYEFKKRVAGDAWPIALVFVSSFLCIAAYPYGLASPCGIIGSLLAITAVVIAYMRPGSWNRSYYVSMATFPIMAFAILCATTILGRLPIASIWFMPLTTIGIALLAILARYHLSQRILSRLEAIERRRAIR